MENVGISKLDLKRQNRRQILRLLRNAGPTSRIDIAHTIHITKAAVTIITNEMIREGILQEIGEQAPTGGKVPRGRKKILLDYNPTWRLVLGVSVQGEWLDVGLCTLRGETVEHHALMIDPSTTFQKLVQMVGEVYHDLAYKNDLKPEMILALGVTVDPAYRALCRVETKGDAEDYGALREELEKIVPAPIVFGRLTDGLATAESDFRPGPEKAPLHQVILQMGGSFQSTVTVGQEYYRGGSGRSCNFGDLPLGDGTRRDKARDRLSREAVSGQIKALHTQKLSPALDALAMDNPQRAEWTFCRSGFTPEDPAVRQYFERIREDYLAILMGVLTFLDPEQLVVFPDGCVMEALAQAMRMAETRTGVPVRLSRFDETNLYLTGAALAVREYFTNRGGYIG